MIVVGPGGESHTALPGHPATIAQTVELLTCNEDVAGSIPAGSSTSRNPNEFPDTR
jgi:hypothetical protein